MQMNEKKSEVDWKGAAMEENMRKRMAYQSAECITKALETAQNINKEVHRIFNLIWDDRQSIASKGCIHLSTSADASSVVYQLKNIFINMQFTVTCYERDLIMGEVITPFPS